MTEGCQERIVHLDRRCNNNLILTSSAITSLVIHKINITLIIRLKGNVTFAFSTQTVLTAAWLPTNGPLSVRYHPLCADSSPLMSSLYMYNAE